MIFPSIDILGLNGGKGFKYIYEAGSFLETLLFLSLRFCCLLGKKATKSTCLYLNRTL